MWRATRLNSRPIIFLIYINDLCNASNVLEFILFADDTNIFYSHQNRNILMSTVNTEIEKLSTWLQSNRLSINPKETNFIPEPTAQSAVPGISPGRGLLIPLGYLHPGKCEHSEVQSHPPLCNRWSTLDGFRRYAHARVQAKNGLVSIKLVIG